MFLPSVADRGEFTPDYSLELAIVISLYASMEKHVFLVLVIACIQPELMRTSS